MPARDEFNAATIQRMRLRVALRCSNPVCRRSTVGPTQCSDDGVVTLGVAAHIHAAAKGGPRYLPTMSSGERRSIQNGIWLCTACGTLIDRDETAYPPELLRTWKREAERLAASENNQRLPSAADATAQLVTALSGQPIAFIPNAIGNTHRASAQALERMDPRFQVTTKHEGDTTTFTLNAKEEVPFKMLIPQGHRDAWREKLDALVQHGVTAELDASGVRVDGSPLLAAVFDDEGMAPSSLRIEVHGSPVRVKLAAIAPDGRRHTFDDVVATLTPGGTSFRVHGPLWDGLANLTVQATHAQTPWRGRFNLSIDYGQWVGKDIRRLPHLNSVLEFFEWADQGAKLDLQVVAEGESMMVFHMDFDDLTRQTPWRQALLEYLRRARDLTRALGVTVTMPSTVTLSPEAVDALDRAYHIVLRGILTEDAPSDVRISFPLEATAGGANVLMLRERTEPCDIRFDKTEAIAVPVLGEIIRLPLMSIYIQAVIPRVRDDRAAFSERDLVQVELEPTEAFSLTFEPLTASPVGGPTE